MNNISTSLEGRLKKFKLPTNKSLIILFEAIANSIDSLNEVKDNNKIIKIYILREDTLQTDTDFEGKINGFHIEDNGIGFNEDNFKSFYILDSLKKLNQGGKGIGRLSWLKVFKNIEILSTFLENNKYKRIAFSFTNNGIENKSLVDSKEKNRTTFIKLENIKDEFINSFQLQNEVIADKIIEHYMSFFILMDINIYLIDNKSQDKLHLNQMFKDNFLNNETTILNIKDQSFQVRKVILKKSGHKLLFMANNRVVKTENLSKHIIELQQQLGTDYILYFVSSEIFDTNVNDTRTDFEGNLFSETSFSEIQKELILYIDKDLKDELNQVKQDNRAYLNNYVKKEAPQYKSILRIATEEQLRKITSGMTSKKMEKELFEIKQAVEKTIKQESQKLYAFNDEEMQKYVEKVSALNSANLTEYIIYRKTIIDALAKYLKNNTRTLEKEIHKLVYPMKTTDNLDYSEHNLWLIDDRLAFHNFIASDVQFNKFIENSKNADRPDILIFDKPFIFSNTQENLNLMILIEFKRPKRDDYKIGNDPITQVFNYLNEIGKSNKIITNDNMPLTISQNIQKYIYIIADLTNSFEEVINMFSFLVKSQDNTGYFGFDNKKGAYFEIISYEKLLKDTKNRNKVFFDKLGL
jgi:hypothetical protein